MVPAGQVALVLSAHFGKDTATPIGGGLTWRVYAAKAEQGGTFKLLKEDWTEAALTAAFAVVNLAPEIRAEQVSLEQFSSLARELGKPQ